MRNHRKRRLHNNDNKIKYKNIARAVIKEQEKSEAEENSKRKFTSGAFAMLISITLRTVAVIGCLFSIVLVIGIFGDAPDWEWVGFIDILLNIFLLLFVLAIATAITLYSIVLWKSAKEIEKEKDRNYIISVFSGIVSFAALIVALIALFKGVR